MTGCLDMTTVRVGNWLSGHDNSEGWWLSEHDYSEGW